jgi:hypothetical protein
MTMSLVIPQRSQPELTPPHLATIADWLAEPEDRGAELLGGYIVYKAFPSLDHARTQRKLGLWVDPFDHRPGDGDRPGGWWIGPEVDILIANQGVRPDMAGWRRDRFPNKPRPGPEGSSAIGPIGSPKSFPPATRHEISATNSKYIMRRRFLITGSWIRSDESSSCIVATPMDTFSSAVLELTRRCVPNRSRRSNCASKPCSTTSDSASDSLLTLCQPNQSATRK